MFIELEPVFNNIGYQKTFSYDLPLEDSEVDAVAAISGKVENRTGVVYLEASATFSYTAACARCLKEVPQHVNLSFSHVLTRSLNDLDNDELILVEDMHFSPDELLREDVLLSLPTKVLCKEDCKGLCPQCGVNLNEETCTCKAPGDPRLEALRALLSQDLDS